MGLFKSKAEKQRLKTLDENQGIPFMTEILDNMDDCYLAYNYDKVKCKITGNPSGLKSGAILYTNRNGVLNNVLDEEVAQIINDKIIEMINDFFGKEAFASIRAKYVSVDDDYLYCNLGFYRYTKKGKAAVDSYWDKLWNGDGDEDEDEEI